MKVIFKVFLYTIIITILSSCNNSEAWKNYPLADSTQYKDSVKRALGLDDESLGNVSEKHTFSKTSIIFSQPSALSSRIEELPFYTNLKIIGNPLYSDNREWYKIKIHNYTGYIETRDLALQEYEYGEFGYNLVLGLGDEGVALGSNGGCLLNRVRISDNKILESLSLPSEGTHFIKEISTSTLISKKNEYGKNTLLVYTTSLEACPGTTVDCFMIDTGKKLVLLAQGLSQGEEGWSQSSTVFVPMKFENGKVMLVARGDIENIFNNNTAELNTFPYPTSINVPIENLIVVKNADEEYEFDKDENLVTNKDGSYKLSSSKYSTEFYSWDGVNLLKIKEIAYNSQPVSSQTEN